MWNYLRKPPRFTGCLLPYSIMAVSTPGICMLRSISLTWLILSMYFCWQEGRMFSKTDAAFLFFANALLSDAGTVWPFFETIPSFCTEIKISCQFNLVNT